MENQVCKAADEAVGARPVAVSGYVISAIVSAHINLNQLPNYSFPSLAGLNPLRLPGDNL